MNIANGPLHYQPFSPKPINAEGHAIVELGTARAAEAFTAPGNEEDDFWAFQALKSLDSRRSRVLGLNDRVLALRV